MASAINNPERWACWRFEDEDEGQIISVKTESKMANAQSLVLYKEDHTIGNIVRMQLLRDNRVRYAGYKMPHPTIHDCHIKIQTMEASSSSLKVFDEALEDLGEEVSRLKNQFSSAYQTYSQQME